MTSSLSECITAHLEFSHGMTDLILLPDIVDKCCDFLFFFKCMSSCLCSTAGMGTAQPEDW